MNWLKGWSSAKLSLIDWNSILLKPLLFQPSTIILRLVLFLLSGNNPFAILSYYTLDVLLSQAYSTISIIKCITFDKAIIT